MQDHSSQSILFCEMFPILQEVVPHLYAWHINTSDDHAKSVGWKLAYRLRRELDGLWFWSHGYLISDRNYNAEQMLTALRTLWQVDNKSFSTVRNLSPSLGWQPDPKIIADFVVFGLASKVEREIRRKLSTQDTRIRNAIVERDYNLQSWVVQDAPAMSISVFSHLISTRSLQEYITTLSNSDDCIGLLVKDKLGSYKGEITEVVGHLGEYRDNLLHRTSRSEMRQLIEQASDDDLVVKVKQDYNSGYDYVASALHLIIRNQDFNRLNVDGNATLSALQIPPRERSQMVESIARILRGRGWIGERVYSSSWLAKNFVTARSLNFPPTARMGDGFVCECDNRTILRALSKHPPYRRSAQIENIGHLRVGIVNFIGGKAEIPVYLAEIRNRLAESHFPVHFTAAQRPNPESVLAIEQAVETLCNDNPHILLAFMPGSASDESREDSLYHRFKALVVGRDLPSQVIFESTLENIFAVDNIVLGILGKTGNFPYVLSEPLPYTDIVAGIDIARSKTQRRSGSINLAAVVRIYNANGDLIRYTMHDAPLEGEILPKPIIHRLLPAQDFAGKRAIIQRDGPFQGYEQQDLQNWADEIGATFHLIEIIKSGTPRIYMAYQSDIQKPPRGTLFKINEREGFVVTTTAHKGSTPRPLTIRTDGSISVEQAAHSVLAMTMLHYGSLRPPRLPVTIHYSDRIGYLALQGIKPKSLEGTVPFWL